MAGTTSATGLLFEAKPRWSGTIGSGGVAAAGTTTIPLSSAANLDNGDAYIAVINRVTSDGTKNSLADMETFIGELSGTNFINCVRGVEGTAQAWDAGKVVEILFTASHWNKMIDAFTAEHSPDDGTHTDITATTLTTTGAVDANSLKIDSGSAITAILDEDDLSSDAATALATQQSIKAYVDASRTKLVDSNGVDTVLTSATASAVNEVTVTNSAASGNVKVQASGDDTNINLEVLGKGTSSTIVTTNRQGGDDSNWGAGGTTNYTARTLIQSGSNSTGGGTPNNVTITFPIAFKTGTRPILLSNCSSSAQVNTHTTVSSNTEGVVYAEGTTARTILWIAIGEAA